MTPDSETAIWRFLLGFYKADEALTIVKSQGLVTSPEQESDVRKRISEASTFVKGVGPRRPEDVKPSDVPGSIRDHLTKLEGEPTFKECITGMDRWSWKLMELSELRTFQPSVNWDYVSKLADRVPAKGDVDSLAKFCLPLAGSGAPQRVIVSFNPVVNSYSIVTEHLDLRIVGQVQGEDPATKRKFFGFVTGFGLPMMTAVRYKGTYLLKNGYHRAVALLSAGHMRVPMLVVETDSFGMTGAASPGFFGIDLLVSPKAPLLSDFLSGAAVDVQRPKLRTVLLIHGEAQQLAV